MRLCDVCKEPDPFKRQLAVGRLTFERTDPESPVPKFKSFDICIGCLGHTIETIIQRKET